MNKLFSALLLCITSLLSLVKINAQEPDFSGFEISVDQDYFADWLRNDSVVVDRNYAVSLRLGFYGEMANSPYLGLPWVRQKIDNVVVDQILYDIGFREESVSHNFVFITNGFTPSHISDQTAEFQTALANGYDLENDRPFSSFTGFRSTRRIEGNKLFAHSAKRLDMAITSSFTFGFASLGLAPSVEDLFGAKRPDGNLWEEDETKPYPTGQIMPKFMPLIMYSLSLETAVWQPVRQVVFQLRPEVNLGYYTNIGLGLDIGKVMNVERHVDNLSYTDTHNPSILAVNTEYLSLAISAGVMARAVLYNAHLNGLANSEDDHYYQMSEMKKLVFEAYAGIKLQLFKKLEFTYSISRRSSEINTVIDRQPMWGTVGFKFLMAPEGEGCYD